MKVRKEMAGDILIDAIGVEGVFGEDEVCLTGCTPVGDTIANEEDGIVCFPVDLDEPLFASPAEAAFLIGIGKRDVHAIPFTKMSTVGIEGDFREMVNFQNCLDIEIETIADDFDIDVPLPTILVERGEIGIDVRMLLDKTEDVLLIPFEDFCDSGIGLFRPDLSLAEITIDGLPIP